MLPLTQNLPVSRGLDHIYIYYICMLKHCGLTALVPRPVPQGANRRHTSHLVRPAASCSGVPCLNLYSSQMSAASTRLSLLMVPYCVLK